MVFGKILLIGLEFVARIKRLNNQVPSVWAFKMFDMAMAGRQTSISYEVWDKELKAMNK